VQQDRPNRFVSDAERVLVRRKAATESMPEERQCID